jgi:dihydrofolate reductase
MGKVVVDISMSLDGFITGPNVNEHQGLGEGGEVLHAWLGEDEGKQIISEAFASSGAVITSRAVYDATKGWGDDGLYQMPVFVLTHRPHEMVVKGATTFTFVTDGIESAVAQALDAAGDKDVHMMGGGSVIQQAFKAGLLDELHLHVAPVILGAGTPLFSRLTMPIELEQIDMIKTRFSTHLRYRILKA